MYLNEHRPARPCSVSPWPDEARRLEQTVRRLSMPRHRLRQSDKNLLVRRWLERAFLQMGLSVVTVGRLGNLLAVPKGPQPSVRLVCAHYDSVPNSPGADDNASGLAVMLACARRLARTGFRHPVGFLAVNAEEEGLLGSREVSAWLSERRAWVREAHVLEMVGFRSHVPGSQRSPDGILLRTPEVGDFIGLLTSGPSNAIASEVIGQAKAQHSDLPVMVLKTYLGVQRLLPVLQRSDHFPFWEARIPAVLWTDTAEFRNPHYHLPTDTPDTLDYLFMQQVTELLWATITREEKPC